MFGSAVAANGWLRAFILEARIPQWRELLFGHWAFSWAVWLLQSLLGLGVLAFRLRALGNAADNVALTLLIGPVGSAIVLLIARITLRGRSPGAPLSPLVVLGVWLLACTFRGLGSSGLGVVTLTPSVVVGSIVYGLMWTAILTYVVASSQYWRERSDQLAELIEITASYDREKAALLVQERARLLRLVQGDLLPALVELRGELAALRSNDDRFAWLALADRVGGLVIDHVRFMSREESLGPRRTASKNVAPIQRAGRLRSVVADAQTARVSVVLSIMVFVAGGILVLVPRVGLIGYAFLGSIVVCAFPMLLFARWVTERVRSGWAHALILALSYLGVSAGVVRVASWFPGSIEVRATFALEGAIAVFAMFVGVGSSLVRQHQRRWEAAYALQLQVLDEFAVIQIDIERENLGIQRQMSSLLHGPVQGKLAALTLALRVHSARPEEEFLGSRRGTIERGESLVDETVASVRDILAVPRPLSVDLEATLDRLTKSWRGLITLRASVEPEVLACLHRSPGLSLVVLSVVEEGLVNASRHGNARNVDIRVSVSQATAVLIELDNDGRKLVSGFMPGFGLHSIEALGGRWTLHTVPSGATRLTAVVPVVE